MQMATFYSYQSLNSKSLIGKQTTYLKISSSQATSIPKDSFSLLLACIGILILKQS